MEVIVQCKCCGKEIVAKSVYRMFCDSKCYEKFRWQRIKHTAQNSSTERSLECRFGIPGIECWKKNCSKCGWNPEVAAQRLEKILEKREENYGK